MSNVQQRVHDLQQKINELRLQVHNLTQQARQPLPNSLHNPTVQDKNEFLEISSDRLNPEDEIQYLQQQMQGLWRQINDMRDIPQQITYLQLQINNLQQESIRLTCVLTLTKWRNRCRHITEPIYNC